MSIAHLTDTKREIGKIEKDTGPILVLVGGVHGNEPAGIQSIQSVMDELYSIEDKIHGSVYGIRGNMEAMARTVRYIDRDLNRIWTTNPNVAMDTAASEYKEYLEIRKIIHEIKAIQGDRHLILLDLHTTSAESLPFLLCKNTASNRRLVKPIPVPTIFGVENRIKGTLSNYLDHLGDSAIVFEAGQHDDPVSVKYHISMIHLLLIGSGIMNQVDLEDFEEVINELYHHCRSMQFIFEIMFRYGVKKDESFVMNPGYQNFMKIEQGEVMAHNERGEIVSPLPGRIFMPLYQELGDDGFFIIDEVK
ncbi:MAG: hypothetical protein GY751_17640 [Bacteroidetes bacterium]|nr:hypothetical protein [Bacteroidota bacterium]